MNDELSAQARLWIIAGYGTVFVGNIIFFVGQFSSIVHGGVSAVVALDVLIGPLVPLGTLWAWWWLTQLKVTDDQQRRSVRHGVLGLMFVLLCQATLSFTSFTSAVSIRSIEKWVLASYLLWTVGEVAALIGFLAAYRALRVAPTPSSLEDWDT